MPLIINTTKKYIITFVQVLYVAFRGFLDQKVGLRASALTFYSLLSVVPIVALAFGISKGFGFEHKLSAFLANRLAGQQEVLNWILSMANNILERTQGGLVAGVGLAILFLSIMKVLDNMENSFNDIWQVNKPRSLFRKFSDYVSIMLFAPIIIIVSSSATVTITAKVDYIIQSIKLLGYLAPVIMVVVKIIPYILIWILFSVIYIIMPNTTVKYKSGIIAGIIAGSVFQITQWAYIKFQIGVSAYNGIYGSFAALPLFMIWLQTGWIVVLYGAELAFVVQNFDKFEFDKNAKQISERGKKIYSIYVMHFIAMRFIEKKPAPDIVTIANSLNIHSRIAHDVVKSLLDAELISEVLTKGRKQNAFLPSFDVHSMTIKNVIDRIEKNGVLPPFSNNNIIKINGVLTEFDSAIEKLNENLLLKDIN